MNETQRQALSDALNIVIRQLEDAEESVERNERALARSEKRRDELLREKAELEAGVDW
jgi:hypothetical protein